MSINDYEAKVVRWYHTLSGWAQFGVAAALGFLLGAWLL